MHAKGLIAYQGKTNIPSSFCAATQEAAVAVQLAIPAADHVRLDYICSDVSKELGKSPPPERTVQ